MTPTHEQISDALNRLALDPLFERTDSLLALLRFLLQTTEAEPASIKEASVGVAFYNRKPTYNPRHDSIVRVNVKRLRERLAAYYEGPGAGERVRFEIPLGSYRATATCFALCSAEEAGAGADADRSGQEVADQNDSPTAIPFVPASSGRRGAGVPAVLLVLLLISAVAVLVYRGRAEARAQTQPSARLQAIPLTNGRGLEFEPATTRDGSRLAYVSRQNGSLDYRIFIRQYAPVESPATVLDTGGGDAFYPQWSPDGEQIAFLRCAEGPCEIATVPSRGGAVRTVRLLPDYERPADHPYYQYRQLNPAWTADGRALIFPYRAVADESERLIAQDLGSGRVRTLTSGEAGDEDAAPALSSDGRTVAFLRRHLTYTQVMTLDMTSLETHVLETEPNVTACGVTWAPGDAAVVVGVNRDASGSLLWVPLKGAPHVLEVGSNLALNPMFTGSGTSLMFLTVNRSRSLVKVEDKAAPASLFATKQRNTVTASSADGKHLAFLSDLAGRFEVWVLDRTPTGWSAGRQLTHGMPFYPSSITWSPDGSYLAVGISNTSRLEIVDTKTGASVALHTPGLEKSVIWSPQWSADGRWIYLAAWGEKRGIFRVSTGPMPHVQQVYAGSAREVRLDGDKAIYFAPNFRNGIFRVNLDHGEPTVQPAAVVPGLEHLAAGRAWLVQSDALLYIDAREPVRCLHQLDLATGRRSSLTASLPRVAFTDGSITYLPGQRLLVYTEWAEAAGSQVFAATWDR